VVHRAGSADLVDPTAVVGRRMAGWLLDLALVVGTVLAVLLALGDSFERPDQATDLDLRFVDGDTAVFFRSTVAVVHGWEWVVAGVAAAVVGFTFLVVLPATRGWTPGLLAAELRLVDADGGRPGLRRSVVRTAGWLLDVLPGVPLVGLGAMRFGRHHQRVGDRLAGTYVVDRSFTGRPPTEPVSMAERPGSPALVPLDEAGADLDGVETTTVQRGLGRRVDEPSDEDPTPADAPPVALPVTPSGTDGPPEGVEPDHPVWDADQNRYLMWHGPSGRWAAYDDDTGSWQPL
jgi:uncharacterized RDD family membrane protein YckC